MTRFVMTLDDAVDLVLYAFEHGENGDIFVQKAPQPQSGDFAQAVLEVMDAPRHPIRVIGTRHGEKQYETLLSREEMASAEDMGLIIASRPTSATSTTTLTLSRDKRSSPSSTTSTRKIPSAQHRRACGYSWRSSLCPSVPGRRISAMSADPTEK